MKFQAPRGTEDVLPVDSPKWVHLEQTFRHLAALYGYQELRTPTFEDTDLFVRTSGETSDIVTKQMYTFLDKGDRSMTLKPEGTAPAMRAMIEHSLHQTGSVCRLSYVTSFYRYERPQKGRLREAHQFGLELVGSSSAVADAEIIEASVRFYQAVGIPNVSASINSLGRDECRTRYRDAVLDHAASFLKTQPQDYQERVRKNPLRLLDSKDKDAQDMVRTLPPISNYWEDDSRARFDRLGQLLTDAGVPFTVAPEIVRGLDYYTETVFEIQSGHLGSQSALCGGGRYDHLIKDLGGPATPAVGVGMGVERCLIVLAQIEANWPAQTPPICLATIGDAAYEASLAVAREVRAAGLPVLVDPDGKSMKSQLKAADRAGSRFVVIIGGDELEKGVVVVRDLRSSQQVEVPRAELAPWLKQAHG